MKDRNRAVRIAAVSVIAAGAVLVGASAAGTAWASDPAEPAAEQSAASCGLGANNPSSSNGTISGTGSRTGCGGTVTLTVQVRKHQTAWPDKVVAETSQTGFSNGPLQASGNCDGEGTYFTETRSSSGNKLSSGRISLC